MPTDQLGFVALDRGRFRCPNEFIHVPAGTVEPLALLCGARGDVLVVAGAGRMIQFSADYAFDAAGRITRRFGPLPPGADGMVVRTVPRQGDAIRFGLRQDGTDPAVPLIDLADRGSRGRDLDLAREERRVPGSILAWPGTEKELWRWDVVTWPGYTEDLLGYHVSMGPAEWMIRGRTPDGRRFVVQTVALDGQARLFVLLGRPGAAPVPRYLGMLGPAFATEVPDTVNGPLRILHVRLPQRQGVVVAAKDATFRYRVGGGGWLPADGDAVLLPGNATQLDVRPRRGKAVTLGLP